jgi:ATP-dependent exoDNAse (exonuclease V) beta subunit
VTDLEHQLLKLLDAKRSNRISDSRLRENLAASAGRVCEILSANTPLADGDHDAFLAVIRDSLRDAAVQSCTTNDSEAARRKLGDILSGRINKWGVYCEAARLNAGKRSGADAALAKLRNLAVGVRNHLDLHNDIRTFSELLAEYAIEIELGCKDYKTQRGLVDFTDLETLLLDALTDNRLAELIEKDFSLVLVDEFQDTNPLQLAIFQKIRAIAPRHRWVGDPKQAIFGFRGTDPGLVGRVWQQVQDAETSSLPDNRRSTKGLVQFVGQVFSPIFGDDAQQNPVNEPSDRNIERWLLTCSSKNRMNQDDDAIAIVAGIRQLQREGHRLGDMVVLERSNAGVEKLAFALEQCGVDYLFERPGLLSTREAVLTLAGMRLVLDRNDSLAAATIKHFLSSPDEDTPAWIIQRLEERRQDRHIADDAEKNNREWKQQWAGDIELQPLEQIDRKTASPLSVCELVMEALALPKRIAAWGNIPQRSSNLDSFLKHVAEYEEQMLGYGQAATLGGAILHLTQLAADGRDIKSPPLGHDAVTIMTYHKSKGLQWPVVILSGLNSERDPNMWQPVVNGGGEDVNDPLNGREIRSWCWPFGMGDGRPPKRRTGTTLDGDAIGSPEGVNQALEEEQENLRLLYVGCTRAQSKLVFAHRLGTNRWLQQLPDIDSILPVDLDTGEHALANFETTYVLRRPDAAEKFAAENRDAEYWFSGTARDRDLNSLSLSRFHSPSQSDSENERLPESWESRELRADDLVGGPHFPEGLSPEKYADFGDAIHAYLAALPSLVNVDDAHKTVVASRCLAAYGVSGVISPDTVVRIGSRFAEWVQSKFPNARWRAEVPAVATRSAGGAYRGTLDLLLELTEGSVVVIDHKSAPIRPADCVTKARQFIAQIDAYDEILIGERCKIKSRWIHFPLAGVMVEIDSRDEDAK